MPEKLFMFWNVETRLGILVLTFSITHSFSASSQFIVLHKNSFAKSSKILRMCVTFKHILDLFNSQQRVIEATSTFQRLISVVQLVRNSCADWIFAHHVIRAQAD
jgi:hypothetical protein